MQMQMQRLGMTMARMGFLTTILWNGGSRTKATSQSLRASPKSTSAFQQLQLPLKESSAWQREWSQLSRQAWNLTWLERFCLSVTTGTRWRTAWTFCKWQKMLRVQEKKEKKKPQSESSDAPKWVVDVMWKMCVAQDVGWRKVNLRNGVKCN